MTARDVYVVATVVLLLFALGSADSARAQTSGRAGLLGIGVDVSVTGGTMASLAELGSVVGATRSQAFRTELEASPTVGVTVEVPVAGRISVRADGRLSPGAEMVTRSLTCPVGGVTSAPDHCAARSGGDFWMTTGDLVYRTATSPGLPGAFFRVGAGVKRYDVSTTPTIEGLGGEELTSGSCAAGDRVCEVHVDRGFAGEHTDATGVVGFGLSVTTGAVRISGELSDYVSVFAPSNGTSRTLQHELLLTLELGPKL